MSTFGSTVVSQGTKRERAESTKGIRIVVKGVIELIEQTDGEDGGLVIEATNISRVRNVDVSIDMAGKKKKGVKTTLTLPKGVDEVVFKTDKGISMMEGSNVSGSVINL